MYISSILIEFEHMLSYVTGIFSKQLIICGIKPFQRTVAMVHCVVFGCSAVQKKNPGRSFHQFPNDKKLKRMWIIRINRKDWLPRPGSRVCSYHFKTEDFCRKRPSDVPVEFRKRRLKKDAVPSCNLRGEEEDTRAYKSKTCTAKRDTATADEESNYKNRSGVSTNCTDISANGRTIAMSSAVHVIQGLTKDSDNEMEIIQPS